MNLTEVEDQAIQARMALVVGAKTFDRLFAGIHFDELDGDILFVYAKDEEIAAEVEDNFSLHIQIAASKILKREVNIVMVLPKQFVH
ncbi:hypothetical protein OZ411_15195 [Bradyrhizobium sp. Arg237L]|uniref:hypothetical protein n=1 Tax=Bradyrhizobium sp. Arg237L TaxID=3003352 RepID=UPI00249DC06C|nr:hypothetical protein [Bradyrhizobium sp. Arg237L]MDI4234158.1 hypothetical protein [Bradyrhizobium sp. Arg237L]